MNTGTSGRTRWWTGMAVWIVTVVVAAADLPTVAWQGRTMGSPYTVRIVGGPPGEAELTALKAAVEAELAEVNRQMSNYLPESELSRFNRAAANQPIPVSAGFSRVTRFALELSRASGGAFDPTLGPLINLWGFGEQAVPKQVPAAAVLAEARQRVGWQHLRVAEDGSLRKDLAGLSLDLGAVAKGYGVDQVVRLLHARGWTNVHVSIAGEVRVTGQNPRGSKWRLGISVPVDHWREDQPMAAAVEITDKALSTSGDYQKYFVDPQGKRMSHIIDPRTGAPVQHALAAVTVVAGDSMTADGLSTTLFVLGPEAGMKFLESRRDAAALFILREAEGRFRQLASPRFAEMTGYVVP